MGWDLGKAAGDAFNFVTNPIGGILNMLGGAGPVAKSVFDANALADIERQKSIDSRYGVDKNFENAGLDRASSERQGDLNRALQEALLKATQSFQGGENAQDRSLQETLQKNSIGATSSENALERAAQEALLKSTQSFQGGENAQDRALQEALQKNSLVSASSENALDRALQETLQKNSLGSVSSENALDRANALNILGKQQDFSQKNIDRTRSDYSGLSALAKNDANSGESQFLQETGSALPEVSALQEAVARYQTPQQQEAMRQFKTNLNQQGVRGGQAATLLNRATGDMQTAMSKDINQIALDEAQKRRDSRSSFLGNKAATGQRASYTPPPSFG